MRRGDVNTGFWWGNLKHRDHLEDLDGRIILKCILENSDEGHGLDRFGSGQGQVAGCCECDNEPSGSIKCEGFLE